MKKQELQSELLQTRGKCIKLGADGHFALEITPELIFDINLLKFLDFTTDLKKGLQLIDYDEAVNKCNVFCFEDYKDLTSKITFYESFELFKISDCISDEYIEEDLKANATIFKEVDWCERSKAQLVVFELLDEQGDVVHKELKILVDFDYTKVDVYNWDLLGEFGEYEQVVNGIYGYLSEACHDFEYKWQCDNNDDFSEGDSIFEVNTEWGYGLWSSYNSSANHIIYLMKHMK